MLLSNNRVENLKLLLDGQKINFESENLLLIEQLNISQNQTHKIYKEYLRIKFILMKLGKQIDKAKMLKVIKKYRIIIDGNLKFI